ncbi:MAG: Hpt domain-containing protein [Aliiglaciecola sp.]|uniref:Hpt domain-containing protein n=1 Tax=Aliiglaciecola sp. TaxID=1872441 RepID=UPI003298A299
MVGLIDQSVIEQMAADLGNETCGTLINLFIDEMTTLNNKLKVAFDPIDDKTIGDITHIVKNSAALYGAMSLAEKANEINHKITILNQPITTSDHFILTLMENTLLQYKEKYN